MTPPPCNQCDDRHEQVDVYPGGALADLLAARRFARLTLVSLRKTVRTVTRQVRAQQWRDLKNTFNRYMAEPYHFPPHVRRCGTGWTKARAMRSLRRHGWQQ